MTLEEMFEKLWVSYPADLCKGKRGGRTPAFASFKKIKPDEKEFNRIMANIKAMAKADRMDKNAYRWPFLSTFLNQHRYDDFIMPSTDKILQDELKTCSIDSCNQPVHGKSFKFCAFHIPSAHSDAIKEAWTRTGLDYKSPTFTDDCRKYCRERFNILLGRVG